MQQQFSLIASVKKKFFFSEKLFEKDGRLTYNYTLLKTEILRWDVSHSFWVVDRYCFQLRRISF